MAEQTPPAPGDIPDVRKTVTVQASIEQAFEIFATKPLEWWPHDHVFVKDRVAIEIEPAVGGRYFETGADGEQIAWGVIREWDVPNRIVMTWRVGPGWQPIYEDDAASFIEVDFTAVGPDTTEVALTHAQLHRHGELGRQIFAALSGPSPGDTLAQYAKVVANHVPAS